MSENNELVIETLNKRLAALEAEVSRLKKTSKDVPEDVKLKVTVNGVAYDVDVDVDKTPNTPMAPILFGGGSGGPMKASGGGAGKAGEGEIPAPLAGTVAKILVAEGDAVKAGQVLLTLEAMKMETEINAPADGTVKGILVAVGDAVQGGQGLVALG